MFCIVILSLSAPLDPAVLPLTEIPKPDVVAAPVVIVQFLIVLLVAPAAVPKLAKAIADASWGEFVRQLEYKALWYGRTIVKMSPFYPSSRLCSNCDVDSGKKPLNIRKWTCECGATHDRDINAAKNIHTAGLAEIKACADIAIKDIAEAGIPIL